MTSVGLPSLSFGVEKCHVAICEEIQESTSDVMPVEAWRTMATEMGVENMGGPAVNFLPALPNPIPPRSAAAPRLLGQFGRYAQEVFLLLVRKVTSLPPQTILGGWLYVTACHLARTHRRTRARRWQRENQLEVTENLMSPTEDNSWLEYEPQTIARTMNERIG